MAEKPPQPENHSVFTDFVQSFHVHFDGSFPDVETTLGPSSYALLAIEAEALAQNGTPPVVLDLGCGSGRLSEVLLERGLPPENLVGVDFVAEQIERTRQRLNVPAVRLFHAQSQDLPLDDSSIDCVLNHMGLAVMVPVDATLKEVGRVLRSGGRMAVVVDGPPKEGSIDKSYNRILRETLGAEQPDMLRGVASDPDVSDPAALARLVHLQTGMDLQSTRSFELLMRMSVSEYLTFLEGEYLMRRLQDAGRQQVRDAVARLFESHGDDQVVIPLAMQIMVFAKPPGQAQAVSNG
ncbi:MAG: class I SAM-dependent methyltransferase [Rhodobacteraceae bacterium]|nr:class I SAM-dependent methyltransferase [Paracoccaceae bacterium]